jgi:hypothetical protein
MLLRRSEVSLCAANPGFPEELVVRTDRRALVAWWRGDLSFRQAVQSGLAIEGRREWVRAFPEWFDRYLFAAVPPATPATALRGGTSGGARPWVVPRECRSFPPWELIPIHPISSMGMRSGSGSGWHSTTGGR